MPNKLQGIHQKQPNFPKIDISVGQKKNCILRQQIENLGGNAGLTLEPYASVKLYKWTAVKVVSVNNATAASALRALIVPFGATRKVLETNLDPAML